MGLNFCNFCVLFFHYPKEKKETQFVRIVKLRHAVGERRSHQASRACVGSNEVPALIASLHMTTLRLLTRGFAYHAYTLATHRSLVLRSSLRSSLLRRERLLAVCSKQCQFRLAIRRGLNSPFLRRPRLI